MKTIMLVDDEKRLVSLVERYLIREGFRVVTTYNGREALDLAHREKPDLIILDVNMPEMDGFEFVRRYRTFSKIPIILLSARVDEDDKVMGLELGADDYITKPLHPLELMARVQAVLRRAGGDLLAAKFLKAADIVVDQENRTVKIKEQFIDLTPSEFDILTALITSPGRVYSRLDLLYKIRGERNKDYERTIDMHIKNLRGKIEHLPGSPKYIEIVYGIGYRFKSELL